MVYVDDADYYAMYKKCAVCKKSIGDKSWYYHAMMDAYIHGDCPLNNVYGQDVTMHTMRLGGHIKYG